MNKKILVSLSIILFTIFSFTICQATDDVMKGATNNIRNFVVSCFFVLPCIWSGSFAAGVPSSFEYIKVPNLSNFVFFTNSKSSSKFSFVSPGKPTIKLVHCNIYSIFQNFFYCFFVAICSHIYNSV